MLIDYSLNFHMHARIHAQYTFSHLSTPYMNPKAKSSNKYEQKIP